MDDQKVCRVCGKPATQTHGWPDNPVYTCDHHAQMVLRALVDAFDKAVKGEDASAS